MAKERAPKNNEQEFFSLTIDDAQAKLVGLKEPSLGGRVTSFNSATLGKGIVEKGKIQRPNRLAKIITDLREKAKPRPARQPFCVIGLPEDQIFIQMIEVPKELTDPEISRTIEHQSNRLFPISYQKIILDWQEIGKERKKKRILIIAAPQEMIDSLLETARAAKVQPLAIEPKSFALHRVLSFILRKQSLILIDFEQENASLSIYQNGEIKFHTKIGAPLTVEAVAGAISRTLHYYRDKYPQANEIKRVVFSGDTGEKYFMEQIGQRFPKIQVEKITLPEFKASKEFNERRVFLASAIALALKEIDLFAKHKSINLLPTDVKLQYRVNLSQYYISLIARLTIIFAFFLVAILAIFTYKTNLETGRLAKIITSKEIFQISEEVQQQEEIVERINRKSAKIAQLHQNKKNLPSLIEKITSLAPKSLSLTVVSYTEGKGTIAGIGARDDIIDFRGRLAKEEEIASVNLPLSSLEREQEADFRLEFTINYQ